MKKVCKANGCTRSSKARGFCIIHYNEKRKSGELCLLPKKEKMNGGSCSVENCNKRAGTRNLCDHHYKNEIAKENPCKIPGCNQAIKNKKTGLCGKHQYRLNKFGKTDDIEYKNSGKVCKINNCDEPAITKHLCRKHYNSYQQKKVYKQRRNDGVCPGCGGPLDTKNMVRCSTCNKKHGVMHRSRVKRLTKKGICAICGQNAATVFQVHRYGNVKKSIKPVCDICYFKRIALHNTKSETNFDELRNLWEKQEHKCPYTGETLILGENTTIDHRTPKSLGGSSDIENLQWTSWKVNVVKGALTHDEFIDLCYIIVEHNEKKKLNAVKQEECFSDWVGEYTACEVYP